MRELDSLILMYCRDTSDLATEHIIGCRSSALISRATRGITDRTPELLSQMDSLEKVTLDSWQSDECRIGSSDRLPRLRELLVSGPGITPDIVNAFPARVRVHYSL